MTGRGILIHEVSRSHIQRRTNLYLIKHSTQQTDTHSPCWIGTHKFSRRAVADHALDRMATGTGVSVYTSILDGLKYEMRSCLSPEPY
jgi:hypothetical protein